jgi:VanZ family protein
LKEPTASHRIVRILLLGYLAFLVYASLYPISSFRPPEKNPFALLFGKMTISRTDALGNLLVYLPLGWLLAVRMPGLGSLRAALFGCVLSLTIEYLQAYLPGRVPSFLDWGLNSAGTLLGAELASRLGRIRHDAELFLAAGPRARLGLVAVGTWVAAQLFPFVPSVDIDYLREGLRPVWHVLRGQTSFSFAQASVYALATLSLSGILAQCLRPSRLSRLLVPLLFFAVLLAKVPLITRQLSLEALAGALVGLAASWWLSDSTPGGTVPFTAALGAFVVDELRSEDIGPAALVPFSWIPFRNHLTNELVGAADILSGAWPFLALAFVVSGWQWISPRRAALGGAALVFSFVLALEWVQRFLPGRTPDVTDALIALCAWLLPWFGINGSGRASGPISAPEDRFQNLARRQSRPPESR